LDKSVQAHLRCAFRRTDISTSLLLTLEKRFSAYFSTTTSIDDSQQQTYQDEDTFNTNKETKTLTQSQSQSHNKKPNHPWNFDINNSIALLTAATTSPGYLPSTDNLSQLEIYQLKHHELFYSKFIESNVPVDCFRGKLSLNLLQPDIDNYFEFIHSKNNNDKFFYLINYDPNMKVLSADRGQIRIGSKFQAEIPKVLSKTKTKSVTPMDTLVWDGYKSSEHLKNQKLYKTINDIIEIKQQNNDKKYSNHKINETHDKIMVNF
jgi:hypothetical protein